MFNDLPKINMTDAARAVDDIEAEEKRAREEAEDDEFWENGFYLDETLEDPLGDSDVTEEDIENWNEQMDRIEATLDEMDEMLAADARDR